MTGKYQAYPEYVATNTDWLGEAPKHWETICVGRLFTRVKRVNHVEEELLSVYRDYGVIPKSSREDNNNKPSDDLSLYQLVEPNDLVLNKMKTWQGSIAISEYKGIVSPAYFVYQPLPKLFDVAYPKYVHYLMRNPMYVAQYLRLSKGIRVSQWDLDPEEFQRVELLLPAKDEQLKIFHFLDHETAKIDTLIEKQQQLIKLLKEKRQAVISHAVTKGLNPNAPMRDSGVEWLGEVPAHWVSSALKHYARVVDCKHITAEFFDEGIPLASISEVKERYVNLATAKLTTEKYYLDLIGGGRKPQPGDIIYSRNATVGEAALVAENMPEFAMGQDVCLIRMGEDVLPEYIHYVLKSGVVSNQLDLAMVGSTFKRINVDDIRNFAIALPSYNEQVEIAAELSRILDKYDILVTKAEATIELVSERRTALISAAVTGKIDVRNWQVPAL
jgi:type I restriction enzyme S subunit